MKVVIDTNIAFSSFLRKSSKEFNLIQTQEHNFFIVDYTMIELFKNKEKLLKCSKLSENEIIDAYQLFIHYIKIINENEIPKAIRLRAYEICKDIDVKDTVFVAASLFLDAYLWTGDKILINKLPKKGFDKVITTGGLSTG
jgi:putative PIN family toxin of toxin-antitoxin system